MQNIQHFLYKNSRSTVPKKNRCCGTGTAALCLSETRIRMHSVSGSGFGSRSNIKWKIKVKNLKSDEQFLGNNAALNTKRQYTVFREKNSFYTELIIIWIWFKI